MGQKTVKMCKSQDISEESGDKMSQKILWGSPVIMNGKRDLLEEEVQKKKQLKCANLRDISEESGDKMSEKYCGGALPL